MSKTRNKRSSRRVLVKNDVDDLSDDLGNLSFDANDIIAGSGVFFRKKIKQSSMLLVSHVTNLIFVSSIDSTNPSVSLKIKVPTPKIKSKSESSVSHQNHLIYAQSLFATLPPNVFFGFGSTVVWKYLLDHVKPDSDREFLDQIINKVHQYSPNEKYEFAKILVHQGFDFAINLACKPKVYGIISEINEDQKRIQSSMTTRDQVQTSSQACQTKR